MKKYILATRTAEYIKEPCCCAICDEESLLSSDYSKHIPKELYETTIIKDKIESYIKFPLKHEIEWVTAITRIK